MPQQERTHAVTARSAQKIHLAQFAHLELAPFKRAYTRATHHLARSLDDEIGRTRRAVGLRHGGSFHVHKRRARCELRQYVAKHCRDRRVVGGTDESDKMLRAHGALR
jgi:hypothetical protein